MRDFCQASAVACALLSVAGGAHAQSATQREVDRLAIEEIVVTALKRPSLLQETPLSILAITGETLREQGIDNVTDLMKVTPGLATVDQGASQRRLVIRGVQSAGESQTGLYFDEMPVSAGAPSTTNDAGQRMPEVRLYDVERLEVLRGPQGTLYGAGSMGGTVRVLFNKPTNDYAASVDGTFDTTSEGDNGYQVNSMVNVPLIDDQLATRGVFFYRDRGGYVDNVTLRRDNINEETSRGGRMLLRYSPMESMTVDAAVHIQREDAFLSAWELAAGTYRTAVPTQLPIKDDFELYNLTLNWDLGFATLTGVTSLFERELLATIDASRLMANFGPFGAPHIPGVLYQPQDIEDRSHELRLSSSSEGPLTWTAGVYFEKRDSFTLSEQFRADPATGLPLNPAVRAISRNIRDVLEQRAAFGEVSYRIIPALNLTLGGRYFDYDKTITGETTIGFNLLNAPVTPPTTVDSDEDGFVSKVGLSYDISEDVMVYVLANEGFRPGGANQVLGLPEALTPYEADSLWNYEIGAKTSWLDDRLVVNVAAYRIDWENMQVTGRVQNGAINFISNAGEAQIEGVELEMLMRPMPGLEVTLAGNYTDARLSEDQVSPTVVAPGRKGDRVPNVPKESASLAVKYEWPLSTALQAMVRADVSYVGEQFSEFRPNNVFFERIEDYTLTNVRVGVANLASEWSVSLFANNVFDEVAIGRVLSSAFGRDIAVSAPPRTFGINFTKGF